MSYGYRLIAALAAAMLLLLGAPALVHAQSWQWAHEGSGSANDLVGGVAVDSLGNAYIAGTYEQNIAFGSTIFNNGPNTGMYVAKYSATGVLQWAVSGLGNGSVRNMAVAAGKDGDVLITGTYSGTIRFGTDTLRSQGSTTEAFVARLNTNGTTRWIRRAALGAGDGWGMGVTVDKQLNVWITGYFTGTGVFDTVTINASGGEDAFVAKYDRNGVILWAKRSGGPGNEEGLSIGADAAGNTYITGRYNDSAFFGTDTLLNVGGSDGFVAKFSTIGAPTWGTRFGGPGTDIGNGIAVDPFGNSVITGSFRDSARFDTMMLRSRGGTEAFVAKVDGVGDVRWAVRMGGVTDDAGYAVTVDNVGSVYATGYVSDTADFGSETLPIVPNNADVFVVKYDAGGAYKWVRTAGGTGRDEGHGVAIDGGGELRVSGVYSGVATFSPLSLTATGQLDVFTAKLGADPTITLGLLLYDNFCTGDQFQIPFTVKGVFGSGNYYVGQISDSNGSFANPIEIGRVFGIGGTAIQAKIPDTLPSGSHYHVRVVSTVPVASSGPNNKDLGVSRSPTPIIAPSGPVTGCKGDTVILDAGPGVAYLWNNGEHTRRIFVTTSGEYAVTVTNDRGCNGTSPRVVVTFRAAVRPVITRTGSVLESTPAVTYQWLREGAPIPGATSRTYSPVQLGNYRVVITDSLGCKETSDPFFFSASGVASERVLEGVTIYPRPNTGIFTIAMPMAHTARVRITIADAVGRTVAAWDEEALGGNFEHRVDIRQQPAGVYFVRIETGGRSFTGEVVKQ